MGARTGWIAGAVAAMVSGCAPHGQEPLALEREPEDRGTRAGESVAASMSNCEVLRGVEVPEDPAEAFAAGERDAALDLAEGRLALEVYGTPGLCRERFGAYLRAEYGAALRVTGCLTTTPLVEHARAYNRRMQREIERRHGDDALHRAGAAVGCWSDHDRRPIDMSDPDAPRG